MLKNSEYSEMQARAIQIRDESHLFMDKCRMNIQKSTSLCDETARLREEAMILKEECIADKSKSLAILKLTNQHRKLIDGAGVQTSSIDDDTSILKQMIDEVIQASIAQNNPLHILRTHLLGLSFLPDPCPLDQGRETFNFE